jgi:hypothetical protein
MHVPHTLQTCHILYQQVHAHKHAHSHVSVCALHVLDKWCMHAVNSPAC